MQPRKTGNPAAGRCARHPWRPRTAVRPLPGRRPWMAWRRPSAPTI